MAIIQLTPTGASGEGTNQLSPTNFSVNTSRSSQRSTTFTAGEYGLNKLTITQEQSPALFISFNDSNINRIVSPSSATLWTVSGSTNGRYMRYSLDWNPSSSGVPTISSAEEFSNGPYSGTSITTSYGSGISNFIGGKQEFEYRVTINIPSGASADTYKLTVYSSDTLSDNGAVFQQFTLTVTAQAVDVQSVSIKSLGETVTTLDIGKGTSYKYNNQTITVNSNSRNKLTYEVYPSDATIVGSAVWSSVPTVPTSVATVSSSGLVTGKNEGTTTITCTVTDANGHTASATCTVNVYEQGTITIADNLTILYNELSRSVAVSHSNIMTNSTWTINKETRPWISSVTINQAHTSITATRVTSDQTSFPAPTNMSLTATDMLRNTITSNIVILAQEVRAAINGVDAISDVSNKSTYTASYLPFNITGSDNQVEWYIGNEQQAPYASITNATTSSCVLNVLEGANNQEVNLTLRNLADNTITAHKLIMTTYVTEAEENPFVIDKTSIGVLADDTNNYTPHITLRSVPAVSWNQLSATRSGIINSVALNSKTHNIFVTFSSNSGDSARSGSVTVTYSGDGYSQTVSYSQGPSGGGIAAAKNAHMIIDINPSVTYSMGTITASFNVLYSNNNNSSFTFKGTGGTVTGYSTVTGPSDPSTETIFYHEIVVSEIQPELSEVEVPANSSVSKHYEASWSFSGDWSEVKSVVIKWVNGTQHSTEETIVI